MWLSEHSNLFFFFFFLQVLSTAGEGAAVADASAPWYIYAGALTLLLAFSKVATNIASEALADIDEE
jgi:hypothetical protein